MYEFLYVQIFGDCFLKFSKGLIQEWMQSNKIGEILLLSVK